MLRNPVSLRCFSDNTIGIWNSGWPLHCYHWDLDSPIHLWSTYQASYFNEMEVDQLADRTLGPRHKRPERVLNNKPGKGHFVFVEPSHFILIIIGRI